MATNVDFESSVSNGCHDNLIMTTDPNNGSSDTPSATLTLRMIMQGKVSSLLFMRTNYYDSP